MTRAEEVVTAYDAWDPQEESSAELAERLGISKTRLYQILEQEGATPKSRRQRGQSLAERGVALRGGWLESSKKSDSDLVQAMAERGVRSLLEELEDLRREVCKYRERYGPLE